jgi:guanyl-specific ribonuclease Sa
MPRRRGCNRRHTTSTARGDSQAPTFLPPEAGATLELIESGGPFPYERDGSIFQNREGRLPARPRGYYREYTVSTPGSRDRGARRIVSGGDPPEVYYYTDDHYRTFRRVEVSP